MSRAASIRFPDRLYAQIAARAAEEHRSFAQMVFVLCEWALSEPEAEALATAGADSGSPSATAVVEAARLFADRGKLEHAWNCATQRRAKAKARSETGSRAAECPRWRSHRKGSYCKECGEMG